MANDMHKTECVNCFWKWQGQLRFIYLLTRETSERVSNPVGWTGPFLIRFSSTVHKKFEKVYLGTRSVVIRSSTSVWLTVNSSRFVDIWKLQFEKKELDKQTMHELDSATTRSGYFMKYDPVLIFKTFGWKRGSQQKILQIWLRAHRYLTWSFMTRMQWSFPFDIAIAKKNVFFRTFLFFPQENEKRVVKGLIFSQETGND